MEDQNWITSSEITKRLDISVRQLYYWELKGAVQPHLVTLGSREFKRYSKEDVEVLKCVKNCLDEGYTLSKAMEKASKLNVEEMTS
jgi:MerR family transcriptional regulator, global nitrogen regulator